MDKKIIVEAPDQYGLPTDDEIRADIEKEYERRRQERDTAYQKKDQERRDNEARELKAQEIAKKGQEIATKLGNNPSFEQAFDELVPQSGACESIGGELLRAVNKMEYRWYNDGDKFYEDYGLETCGSCAAYVVDMVERFMEDDDVNGYNAIPDSIRNCAGDNFDGEEYSDFIDSLKEQIISFVFNMHPETLGTPVDKDCNNWTDPSEYWEDYIPKYEVELSIPYEVIEYYDKSNGDFDIFNVIEFVQTELDNYDPTFGAEVDTPWGHYDEYVLVKNLTNEGKNEVERWNNENFFEGLLEELRDRYNDDDYSEEDDEEVEESLKENLYQATVHCTDGSDTTGVELFDLESDNKDDIIQYAIDNGMYKESQRDDIEVYDIKVQESLKEDNHFIEWVVLGYDADNDVYDEFKRGLKTKEEALTYAKELEKEMKDDSLKSSSGDPYDWIVIDKYEDGNFIGDYTYYGGEIMDAYFMDESFNNQEFNEFMKLSAQLGLKTMGDVDKFSKEHNNVKDQALLQAMRDAVAKKDECKESVEESNDDYEDLFRRNEGLVREWVFDHDTVLDDIFLFAGIDAEGCRNKETLFDDDVTIDNIIDWLADHEQATEDVISYINLFSKKTIKEDINDERLANCDAWYYIGKYEGEDFMIVDSWESVQEIQKCLNPDFQPNDKYDSSVLDEYINWGFEDAYSTCDNCGEIICTEPTSYSWVPDYYIGENGIICGDCVRANRDISIDYLQELINNPKKANTILTENDLESLGFVRMDGDYQNGWYDRSDSPEEILDNLLEQYPDGAFIFSITGKGQFHTNFEVWGEEDTMQSYEED